MAKKIIMLIMVALLVLIPVSAWADAEDAEAASEVQLYEYKLGNDEMHISLPEEGWYFNTPRKIDRDFLEVSENSKRKLENYMADNDIDYNLVSEDLLDEINIILVNSSQSKMMYNFYLLEEEVLIDRAEQLIGMGPQGDEDVTTTYTSYEMQEFNDCLFMVFEGELETKEQKAHFYQYTTMVNGFGITCTYRGYDGADYESGKLVLDQIVHSLRIDEI